MQHCCHWLRVTQFAVVPEKLGNPVASLFTVIIRSVQVPGIPAKFSLYYANPIRFDLNGMFLTGFTVRRQLVKGTNLEFLDAQYPQISLKHSIQKSRYLPASHSFTSTPSSWQKNVQFRRAFEQFDEYNLTYMWCFACFFQVRSCTVPKGTSKLVLTCPSFVHFTE